MAFCGDNAILAEYAEGIKINPLRCNRWSCEYCSEKRRRRLRAEAFRGEPNTFITLTSNPAFGKDPNDRARTLVKAWRKIRRQAAKRWRNDKIPFLAVFEETEAGEPHLHIVARSKWIDWKWLSKRLEEENGAWSVDIQRIRSQKKAAKYISKYVGKDPQKWEGVKRYWRSLDYFVRERKKFIDPIGDRIRSWFERGPIESIIKRWKRLYYRLEVYDTKPEPEQWLVDDIKSHIKAPLGDSSKGSTKVCQVPLALQGGDLCS